MGAHPRTMSVHVLEWRRLAAIIVEDQPSYVFEATFARPDCSCLVSSYDPTSCDPTPSGSHVLALVQMGLIPIDGTCDETHHEQCAHKAGRSHRRVSYPSKEQANMDQFPVNDVTPNI